MNRYSSEWNKAQCLVYLVDWLRRRSPTREEMQLRCGMHKRTLRRYLVDIREMGFDLREGDFGRLHIWEYGR